MPFDYETLTYQDRKEVHDALAATTIKHIDNSGGLFEAMKFDPAASPSQMLETVHLPPAPTTVEEIDLLAGIAAKSLYEKADEEMHRQKGLMSAVRLLMNEHRNIFPVTNHGKIIDVAIFSAAWGKHLERETWQDQNALIISRGVTTIQAFGMAGSEVVQKIGHVFMSFPRTETIEGTEIDRGLMRTNNQKMRSEVKSWLGQDILHRLGRRAIGKSLHMAWSGKTDKIRYGDDHKPEHITLGKVSEGTLDILKGGLALPVTVWDGDEPTIEIGELQEVKTKSDILRVQKWQRGELAKIVGIKEDQIEIDTAD